MWGKKIFQSRYLLWLSLLGFAILGGMAVINSKETELSGATAQVAGMQTQTPKTIGSITYWDQDAGVGTIKARPEQFDFITVFWYALRRDGSVTKYPHAKIDESLITYAHKNNIKVIALIANLPTEDEGGDWDATRVDRVLKTAAGRKKHVADIVALVKKHNFDGVNIDYEALKKSQRDDFTRFIRDLSIALHREKKLVTVSLHPKAGENNPRWSNGSQAQDWKALARYADQLRVMTIEQHWETSGPGPAASNKWMEPIVKYAQKLIPPDKLFIVMPLYGYDWTIGEKHAQGLTYSEVQEIIKKYKPTIKWDETATSHTFTYKKDGKTHTVWYEDARSTKSRMAMLQRLGAKNLTFWRLGHEDPKVWDAVKRR